MPQCGCEQKYWWGLRALCKIWLVLGILLLWGPLHCSEGLESNNVPIDTLPDHFECPIVPPKDFKKKFLYIRDKENAITLLTSRRTPHLLLTKVVAIFLNKYLGYVNVTLLYDDGFFPKDVLRATGYEGAYGGWFVPKALVNVEVWVPPAYQNDGYINYDMEGYLGVAGRQGWFFLENLVEGDNILDHWRSFTSDKHPAVKIFGRSRKEMLELEPLVRRRDSGDFFCEHPSCKKGVFTPQRCENAECSLLFSSYFNTSHFLIEQIEELKLYVSVIWIGPHLNADFISRNLHTSTNRSIIFFHWTPDVVVQPFNLTSVSFPACTKGHGYGYMEDSDTSCRYEMHLFHKFIWRGLKSADIYLYEVLNRIQVTSSDYESLINEYNRNQSLSMTQVACNWMLKNEETWVYWRNSNDKPRLYFVGLFPLDEATAKFKAPGNLPAFRMAVDAINRNGTVLPDHQVVPLAIDTACEPVIVMHEFIKIIKSTTQIGTYNKIIGIVGPACSDAVEPLAGVSKFFQMPIISYGAEGSTFSNREQFPYFYRTIPENKIFRHVYTQLLKSMKWKRVASLTEDGQQYSEYLTSLQDLLQTNGITFHMRKYPQERETDSMEQYLRSLKQSNFKIIIGDFYQDIARRVLCEALKLGMTAHQGYVWFLPRWYADNWYNMSNVDRGSPSLSCSTEEMLRALDGHMTLSYKFFGNDDEVTHENMTVRNWRDKYTQRVHSLRGIPLSDYAGFTYDATWTYALALNKLFREDHSYTSNLRSNKTMKRFIHYLDQTNFMGVSGPVNFTHGTSRLTEIIIWQFNRTYREVGRFYPDPDEENWGTLVLHQHKLKWPLGETPKDGSAECLVESIRLLFGEDWTCSTVIVILCSVVFVPLAFVPLGIVIFLKKRYENNIRRLEEMWKNENVFKKFQGWELQRSRVVINRRLGQGQFGTVYGGECQLDIGWVAVAVKTLKLRASITEKLDFLFEAEIMKELDHDNIVKLLGVITQSEPVYTIMEFMLYGDLKTFLLARRNLINEKSRNDDDEISNRRLTLMALDVAKALEYLEQQNYVHRDVACRNCLVNANLTVKLADFGMTRPLNANNYYRFSRTGPLPVRWMSIESLMEGVFTPMSDMWSYGVLLYEIITFGAFPYTILSNSEVFEKVRSGYTLPIPSAVKPALSNIMRACFSSVPEQRPTAAQLVIQLMSEPRLIEPCLEDPVFCSVPTESSSLALESKGTDRSRRLSLSTSNPRQTTPSGNSQVAAAALQSSATNRKRSMSGNMILSSPWDDSAGAVIEALNLNGSLKSNGTRLPGIGNGACKNHLPPHCENGERETLIKRETIGVTSDLL